MLRVFAAIFLTSLFTANAGADPLSPVSARFRIGDLRIEIPGGQHVSQAISRGARDAAITDGNIYPISQFGFFGEDAARIVGLSRIRNPFPLKIFLEYRPHAELRGACLDQPGVYRYKGKKFTPKDAVARVPGYYVYDVDSDSAFDRYVLAASEGQTVFAKPVAIRTLNFSFTKSPDGALLPLSERFNVATRNKFARDAQTPTDATYLFDVRLSREVQLQVDLKDAVLREIPLDDLLRNLERSVKSWMKPYPGGPTKFPYQDAGRCPG